MGDAHNAGRNRVGASTEACPDSGAACLLVNDRCRLGGASMEVRPAGGDALANVCPCGGDALNVGSKRVGASTEVCPVSGDACLSVNDRRRFGGACTEECPASGDACVFVTARRGLGYPAD